MRAPVAGLVLALLGTPVLAIESSGDSVTCTGAVTTDIGGQQALRDLAPSDLPVLAYSAVPLDRQFKQLARIDGAPIRLYVYRVDSNLLHMQIFEPTGEGKAVLADTPLRGGIGELTWAPLGGHEMVTAYCY